MKPENWIAIYAAVVGTLALFLNFRSWFEKQARLFLSLIPDAVLMSGGQHEKDLMVVEVINRGGQTTTLTNLVILRFDSPWRRWRIRPSKSFVIPNPQVGGTGALPFGLEPGKRWMGVARVKQRPDGIPDLEGGNYFFGVYATHRDRPYLIRIPKPRSKLPPNTKAIT